MTLHAWRDGTMDWPTLGWLRWCSVCGIPFDQNLEVAACPGPPPVLPAAGEDPDTLHGIGHRHALAVLRWTGEAWLDLDGKQLEPAELAAKGWFYVAPCRRVDVQFGALGGIAAPSPGRSAKRVSRPEMGSLFG